MDYAALSASERRFLPPAVAVSTIAFALAPPAPRDAAIPRTTPAQGDSDTRGEAGIRGTSPAETTPTHSPDECAGLWLPLVRRTRAPFLGRWALPGGATQWDETLADTAQRTLSDAVGRPPEYLEQLYSFGGVERSADAQRLVTIAYWALYGGDGHPRDERRSGVTGAASDPDPGPNAHTEAAGAAPRVRRWDDPEPWDGDTQAAEPEVPGTADALQLSSAEIAGNVAWFPIDELPQLAFDHAEIVAHALDRLRSKTEYSQVAHRFLGESFTLAQLRRVHEAVQGRAVDPANFRRQALAQGNLEATGGVEAGTPHRPAKLFRFVDATAGL